MMAARFTIASGFCPTDRRAITGNSPCPRPAPERAVRAASLPGATRPRSTTTPPITTEASGALRLQMTSQPLMPDLSRASHSGVYSISGTEKVALLKNAEMLGVLPVSIDLRGCSDKAELLASIAQALEFPDYFGHNWDALGDCLTDLSWLERPVLMLVFGGMDDLERHDPDS